MINRPSAVAVGTVVWLASEVMFFAALFAVYFSLRSTSPDLWASSTEILNVPFALVNTIILVASSVTCQFGVFAAERLQQRRTGGVFDIKNWGLVEWFFLSYALGAVFLSGQVWEYATLYSEGFTLQTSAYTSAFFVATGVHGAHVLAGLIGFLVIIGRSYAAKKFGHREANSAIVVSYYWHFVDVIWIGLFLVIYGLQ